MGLFFQLLPAKMLASKDDKFIGTKASKVRVTVLLCANMDGRDTRKLLVIEISHKLRVTHDVCIFIIQIINYYKQQTR